VWSNRGEGSKINRKKIQAVRPRSTKTHAGAADNIDQTQSAPVKTKSTEERPLAPDNRESLSLAGGFAKIWMNQRTVQPGTYDKKTKNNRGERDVRMGEQLRRTWKNGGTIQTANRNLRARGRREKPFKV